MHKNLTTHILVGLVCGFVLGLGLHSFFDEADPLRHFLVDGVFEVTGKLFVVSLKMLVVPLVFSSLVCGVVGLESVSKLGRLGSGALLLYLLTTSLALVLAISLASELQPGTGFALPAEATFTASEAPSLVDVLVGIFPSNPVRAAADGRMLQVIVFSILFGVGILAVKPKVPGMIDLMTQLNLIMMAMVSLFIRVAPLGVFALIAKVFAEQGFSALGPLVKYFMLVLVALLLQGFVVYPFLLRLFGLSPLPFLRKIRPVALFAVSTSSSTATIPVTLKVLTESLGVARGVASFTVPLGATINMDGTAIMQGVATLFLAQAYQIDLGLYEYLTVITMATLASIGTAGVPGVGLITLAMVLRQVGLPVEGIGIIMGVDRLLDMMRTSVNVMGDATISCVMAKVQGELDMEAFAAESSEDLVVCQS